MKEKEGSSRRVAAREQLICPDDGMEYYCWLRYVLYPTLFCGGGGGDDDDDAAIARDCYS